MHGEGTGLAQPANRPLCLYLPRLLAGWAAARAQADFGKQKQQQCSCRWEDLVTEEEEEEYGVH